MPHLPGPHEGNGLWTLRVKPIYPLKCTSYLHRLGLVKSLCTTVIMECSSSTVLNVLLAMQARLL